MSPVLIVTPLEKELAALRACLASEGYRAEAVDGRAKAIWFPDLHMLAAAAGHGKAQFAVTTQHLLDRHGPISVVVVAGAAGALSPDLRPGDVVLGTEAVEHDYKPRFHGTEPPPRHATSAGVRKAILCVKRADVSFRLHTGPIASGDEDIVAAERARALYEQTGALCVAWEGAGGARAAAFSRVPFVEIRAVTDSADEQAADSYRVHLAKAVGNIGRVLLPWLRQRSVAGGV